MTHLEVWRTAVVLVRKHGNDAPARAEQRAAECVSRNDPDAWAYWVWIENATRECLREIPYEDERIN
jgi:hypothetical protein